MGKEIVLNSNIKEKMAIVPWLSLVEKHILSLPLFSVILCLEEMRWDGQKYGHMVVT
jgi:hypothetical protein